MVAQHRVSKSPRDLQDREHSGEPREIRTVLVRLADQAQFFALNDTNDCSDRVEAKRRFTSKGKTRGNENRRWHGTTRKCKIGDEGVTKFCSNPSCSLCCIMKTSFDISFFAKKTSFGRFGAGIYTSSTSSKFVPGSSSMPELRSNLFDWVL